MYLKYSAIASIDIHQPKLKVAVDCIQSLVGKTHNVMMLVLAHQSNGLAFQK